MNFTKTLAKLLKKARITKYRLATDGQVDPSYVTRLLNGERQKPSRRVVLALAQALLDYSGKITLKDVDNLLKGAGYGPLPRQRVSIRPYLKPSSRGHSRDLKEFLTGFPQ